MSDRIVLYRAMNEQELHLTRKNGTLSFKKRFKWASQSLEFITKRVQDGRFNNSSHKNGAYKHIVKFDIESQKAVKISNNEWQIDRRTNPKINILDVMYA